MFLSAGCSLLRAEGFSCSLGVLYGRLGIHQLQFLNKKYNFLPALSFFFQIILVIKTLDPELNPDLQLEKFWIRIRIESMRI